MPTSFLSAASSFNRSMVTSQGYRLLSDARLGIRSPIMLSEAQLIPFIESVTQPILAILGKDGLIGARKKSMDFVQLFRQIRVEVVEGGHHLHMEHPERVAGLYLDFLRSSR